MKTTNYFDPQRKGGSIQTQSGVIFYPLDPLLEDIVLEDVAHALSNKCRFTGHTRSFYSSGEHAVRVALDIANVGGDYLDQLGGLHHDDTDSYLPDVPTPLKVLPEFAWFRDLEHYMQDLCFLKFNCIDINHSLIKRSDIRMLLTEKRDLMPEKNSNWNHSYTEEAVPHPYKIKPLKPKEAEAFYLELHHALTCAINGDDEHYKAFKNVFIQNHST